MFFPFLRVGRILEGMSAPNAWEELTPEDLPSEDLQWLARAHGMGVATELWRRCAGTKISLPSRLPKAYAIKYLARHWDGSNTIQMARALRVSERTVQEYLQETCGRRRFRGDSSAQLDLLTFTE